MSKGRVFAPPPTRFGAPTVQAKPAGTTHAHSAPLRVAPVQAKPIVVQRMNSSSSYSTSFKGTGTRKDDYGKAWHSSDVNETLILPEGTERRRKGVERYGLGDGTSYGVGGYCPDGVATTNTTRNFTWSEQDKVNKLGDMYGCHTCGSKVSGWPDGHFTPDHQPPLSLAGPLYNYKGKLFPHCKSCSSHQGGILGSMKKV